MIQFYKTRNFQAAAITLLLYAAMLTENLLTRQNGVVLFAYIIGFHIFMVSHESRSASENRN
jgi:hypothetical protein